MFFTNLPGDFTFVDLQSPLGHVSHALLALLARVHGQVVHVRRLVRHLEVADAAVALQKGASDAVLDQNRTQFASRRESNLSAQVDDPGVRVEERQEDAAAGVQLLQGERLSEVLL